MVSQAGTVTLQDAVQRHGQNDRPDGPSLLAERVDLTVDTRDNLFRSRLVGYRVGFCRVIALSHMAIMTGMSLHVPNPATPYTPHDHAVLCLLRGDGHVLLIRKKRGLGAGKVNAPGGKQEAGEDLKTTAVRETREEVGLVPSEPHHRGILRFAFSDGYQLEVHVFEAWSWSGTMVETDEALPFWCSVDAIPWSEMWEDDQYWLPRVLAGTTVDGSMRFDGDRMTWGELQFADGERISLPGSPRPPSAQA